MNVNEVDSIRQEVIPSKDSDIPQKRIGVELRTFFGDRARKLADEAEQGRSINPNELALLVDTARAILSFEAAA